MTTPPAKPLAADPAASKPIIGTKSASVSAGEHAKTFWTQLRRHFTPPDLWANGRPSLQGSWLWAKHGEHLPDDENVRTGSRVVAWILLPFRAVFLYLDWIFDRGSRVVAAAILVFVVLQIINPIF
jgi:hypothetical protein